MPAGSWTCSGASGVPLKRRVPISAPNRTTWRTHRSPWAAEVARNYFELRGTQKRIDVAQRTLVNLRDTQKLTETRWNLGAGSELDVQSSRARLKAIEADIPLLEVAEVQSRHRLAVLLGQRPAALDALLEPREVAPYAKALPLGDTTDLLRQRADVRVAERRLAAATARVGVATADLFPRISLSGFVGFLSGDASGLVNGNNKAWSVTPSISWAAFDFGTVKARLRASKAQADGAAAEYEKAVLLALEDTENALTRYAKQQARLAIVAEQAQAARRAEQLAQIRYREGSEGLPDPARCATHPAGGGRRVGGGGVHRQRQRGGRVQGARRLGPAAGCSTAGGGRHDAMR
jgi:multidrug efflux system outer membrane protein